MKIEILYPEVCNLYGDLANIRYLQESDPDIEIINTSLKDVPGFVNEKIDLIYMGTTTEKGIELAVKALRPYKDKINSLISENQCILLTGNALDVFGNYICVDDSERIECLGIIDTRSKYYMMNRHNSFFVGKFNDADECITVVGFKSIFGHTYANEDKESPALFIKDRGFGRNPKEDGEGFRINNLMATYLIGPLLLLNPDFCAWLLKKIGSDKTPAHYEAAKDAFNQRLKELQNEHFDPNY